LGCEPYHLWSPDEEAWHLYFRSSDGGALLLTELSPFFEGESHAFLPRDGEGPEHAGLLALLQEVSVTAGALSAGEPPPTSVLPTGRE